MRQHVILHQNFLKTNFQNLLRGSGETDHFHIDCFAQMKPQASVNYGYLN